MQVKGKGKKNDRKRIGNKDDKISNEAKKY